MLTGRRVGRWITICAVPLGLWAALPAVQWCPVGWDRVSVQAMLRCTAIPGAAARCVTSVAARCAAPSTDGDGDRAVAGGCGGEDSCPFDRARAARDPAPVASGHPACVDEQACPMAACAATPHPSSQEPPASHPRRGRAFCLNGPNGGRGVHGHAGGLYPPHVAPAVTAPVTGDLRADTSTPRGEWQDERPPPESPRSLPPARAPPALRG